MYKSQTSANTPRFRPQLRFLLALAMVLFTLNVYAQELAKQPDLSGVWIAPSTAREDPRWTILDFLCNGAFCSVQAADYAQSLLNDPKNDNRPLKEISGEVRGFSRNQMNNLLTVTARKGAEGFDQAQDPVNQCVPTGFNFAAGPLPIEILQQADKVIIRHEFWNGVRTVHMDGRPHPADAEFTRLGHSIGWYDGDTLVVETVAIEPHITYWDEGMRSSPRARVYERYKVTEDGERLEIERTFVDPVMLRRPLVNKESRLRSPDTEIMHYDCEVLEVAPAK